MIPLLLMGLGGLMVGGVIAYWQQKVPRWVPISFGVVAIMAFVAAYLFTLNN